MYSAVALFKISHWLKFDQIHVTNRYCLKQYLFVNTDQWTHCLLLVVSLWNICMRRNMNTCFLDPFWSWMSTYFNDWDFFAFCFIWTTKCTTEFSLLEQLHLLRKLLARSMSDFLRIWYLKKKTKIRWLGEYSYFNVCHHHSVAKPGMWNSLIDNEKKWLFVESALYQLTLTHCESKWSQ